MKPVTYARHSPHLLGKLAAGLFLLTCLSWAAPSVTLRGYGLVNPAKHPSALEQESLALRAAEIDLKRQALYLNGAVVKLLANGYAIADQGHLGDLPGKGKKISPIVAEVSAEVEIPAALSTRVMQQRKVSLKYTGKVDPKNFEASQAYYKWVKDALVKALGDDLVKRGFLTADTVALDFLAFEYTWTGRNLSAKISYVARQSGGQK